VYFPASFKWVSAGTAYYELMPEFQPFLAGILRRSV
jgi:hypothetical protein